MNRFIYASSPFTVNLETNLLLTSKLRQYICISYVLVSQSAPCPKPPTTLWPPEGKNKDIYQQINVADAAATNYSLSALADTSSRFFFPVM